MVKRTLYWKGKLKQSGCKPGDQYGEHARRTVPTPEQIIEHFEVPLTDSCNGRHSGDIEPGHAVVQRQVEIPQKPIYRQFTIATGPCRHCGKTILAHVAAASRFSANSEQTADSRAAGQRA